MSDHYLEVISLIERLHRQFLEVVKLELDALRVHDVNNVQALMLFNMGDTEISVGELTLRGYRNKSRRYPISAPQAWYIPGRRRQ